LWFLALGWLALLPFALLIGTYFGARFRRRVSS
jgi:hypothetical protein